MKQKINLKKYTKIVFCGIGGSAVPGEVVKALGMKKPVLIAREKLPASVNSKTLVFVVSYSGNTKETIKLYRAAKKKKAKIITITSGGKLSKVKDDIIKVSKGYLPREALITMLIPILKVLGIKTENISNILKKIKKSKAKKIAKKIKGKLPIIYASSERLKVVSERWGDELNENAKVLAHTGYFPEISHNEIEARLDKRFKVILLIDKKTRQIEKALKFLKKPIIIKLTGNNLMEKIIYGIGLGDSVSYELSRLFGKNPYVTKRIEWLKSGKKKRKIKKRLK